MLCRERFETKRIAIEQRDINRIEAVAYEYTARKNLLRYLNDNHIDIPLEIKKEYIRDALKFEAEYKEVLSEVVQRYLPEPARRMNFRFDTRTEELVWDERIVR